jgi:CTP:molybdopterin cytidylyltransferase MocA
MGRQKLLEAIDGRPMIRRALDACATWPIVVVASPLVADALRAIPAAPPLRVAINAAPERGMTHSLALAHAAIDAREPIAIVLADMPDLDTATIARVVAAYGDDVDVVIPQAGGRMGHPVVFGPRARAKIADLPDGDALRALRDDPALRRRVVELPDARPFHDIDTEDELAARREASPG